MIITKIIPSSKFKRDIKKIGKKHYPMSKIVHAINTIKQQNIDILKRRLDDHSLHGNLQGYRELHVDNNLLLMYEIDGSTLGLARCCSHDQLFK